MSQPNRQHIESAYRDIQDKICQEISRADGKGTFNKDQWERSEGGGGLTRVLTNGRVLEKAGVNFSAVEGPLSKEMAASLKSDAGYFFATGVSIVMHPVNPHVPIIHMNIRYFELDNGTYWFGGGIDLTPHYVVDEDAVLFHRGLKEVCDKFDPDYYPRFKTWADNYFFIGHRNETRGIGGIFYDHLKADETHDKTALFDFSLAIGNFFPEIYRTLMERNQDHSYSDQQKHWQRLRRGRYVEFNLVYDRGTRFGLLSNGRIESILMSLPAEARWDYNHIPPPGSAEQDTLDKLKKGIDWTQA